MIEFNWDEKAFEREGESEGQRLVVNLCPSSFLLFSIELNSALLVVSARLISNS